MRRFIIFWIRRQLLQIAQRLIAMLWNARHHVINHRSRFLITNRRHRHPDFVHVKGKSEMIRLLDAYRIDNRLLRLIKRNAQPAQRFEIGLHRVFHLRR